MSNAGQALSGVVGAVIGFFVGGPTGAYYGFQVGYLAGTALFPTQLPHLQGPRMGDGQQTVSVIGQPIPWVFGTQTVGGNIIWASPIREVATTQTHGGKGGPEQKQTTYSYFRSFAILLCEGPIGGVRRVWANGKIVYDARPQLMGESGDAYLARQALNGDFLSRVTFYLGTEDQMPDPVIESFQGAGNVPGYRGYAYVVFDDVELKPEDGNRIPAQWKFEVYEDGVSDEEELAQYSNQVLYDWARSSALFEDPRNPLNLHRYRFEGEADFQTDGSAGWQTTLEAALDDATSVIGFPVGDGIQIIGWSHRESQDAHSANLRPWSPESTPIATDRLAAFLHMQEEYPSGDGFIGFKFQIPYVSVIGGDEDCVSCYEQGLRFEENVFIWWCERYIGEDLEVGAPLGLYRYGHPDTPRWPREVGNNNCVSVGPSVSGRALIYSPDALVRVERVPRPPHDPADVGTYTGIPGWYVVDGQLLPAGDWEEVAGTFRVLQKYSSGGTPGVITYPLNPCLPSGHADYNNQAFWEAAYDREVGRGRMPEGLTYGVDYPQTQDFAYRKQIDFETTQTQPVSLASIVSRICERAGLHEYDVSDLADKFVIGYQVARPMAARAAIEPLRSLGFFDAVESGIQLRFPERGKAPIKTLTEDDLGAYFVGEDRPSSLVTVRGLELELPRQVRVHFQNPESDYDPGEELSPARFDTTAEGVLDVDLGAAVTPDMAAQTAEVLQKDFWAGRVTYSTQLDVAHADLEPADCVIVPVDGTAQRVRIVSITERLPNLRTIEMIRDDDGTYVSHATGSASQNAPATFDIPGPSLSALLDLPALDVSHDDAGFYAAAYPAIVGGRFRGASILRSADGGTNYENVGSVVARGTVGTILEDVSGGPTTIFDEATEIVVELREGELDSATEDEVLNGANAAAIGEHGRWELIQFKNATHVSGDVWRISGLLRGRKGTEHATGSTVRGDQFILLQSDALVRIPLDTFDIYAERLYRTVSLGGLAVGDTVTFTGDGIALKPYSPVHVEGSRSLSGDLTITWARRDRLFPAGEVDVPMSEAVEDYEVDIVDENDSVIRTISVSTESAIYTTAQQVSDFGSAQDIVFVRIYQMSKAVGRGYAAEAIL